MSRERLLETRRSVTHKGVIFAKEEVCPGCGAVVAGGRVKFFFTVGFYPDGRPGELFLHMDQAGSTLDGMADAFGTAVSMLLQHGVTLEELVKKFGYLRFEPAGMTKDPEIRTARSVVDYVVRWMAGNVGGQESGIRGQESGEREKEFEQNLLRSESYEGQEVAKDTKGEG